MDTVTVITKEGRKELKSFAVDITNDLVVVHEDVLKRLVRYLPKSNLTNIKDDLITDIRRSSNLPELVDVLEKEMKFHRSVNLITSVDKEEAEEHKPGKIELSH